MNVLEKREVLMLDITDIDIDILHPERVVLVVDGERKGQKRCLDIGAFCYYDRERLVAGKKLGKVRLVGVQSLVHDRRKAVSQAIEYLREMICVEGKSHRTARGWFTDLTAFLDYCDFYLGTLSSFLNVVSGKALFIKYSHHLEHLVQLPKSNDGALNRNTAATKQRVGAEFLATCAGLSRKDYMSGIRPIRKSKASVNSTRLPCEDAYIWAVKVQYALFDGLSRLVLDKQPVPYLIKLPDQDLWFFHDLKIPTASKERRKELFSSEFPRLHIDYESGCVYDLAGLKAKYPEASISQDNSVRTLSLISEVNRSPRHNTRKAYALLATQAFFMHFVAHTGLNPSVAAGLPWDDNFEVSAPADGWRTVSIKRRAHKEVVVEIGSRFKELLLQYIKLREWVLDGRRADRLFVVEGKIGEIRPIPTSTPKQYRLRVARLYPECPWVNPRELRKYKGVWVMRDAGGDLSIAADVLQSSPETIEAYYAEGDEITASQEFEALWQQVRESKVSAIRNKGIPPEQVRIVSADATVTETLVGACDSYNHPRRSDEFNDNALVPDCNRPDGCLFCDHFAIHADAKDIKKLLSCHECLESLRPVFDNEEHYLAEYGSITQRIEEILDQLREDSNPDIKSLIDQITIEVKEDGDLDPWWQRRMEMLIGMGAVSQ